MGLDGTRRRLLRLALLWTISPRALRLVLDRLERRQLSFPWTEHELSRGGIPEDLRHELWPLPGETEVARAEEAMRRQGIRLLVETDPEYPPELRPLRDPPPFLFTRGAALSLPRAPRIGIVGSRAASDAGREISSALARDLALAGCEVVSGLARGIDGQAHRGALQAGGRTLAVLGTGPDRCYPAEHARLMEEILPRGGVISEFPPGTPPLRFHFPRRNRILAALSDVLVVVEGGERSGARSTVDHALDLGREVLAVPREILLPGAALPNRMIRDGARPVLDARDVLAALEEARHLSEPCRPGAVESCDPTAQAKTPVPAGSRLPRESAVSVSLPPLDASLLQVLRRGGKDLDGCLQSLPQSEAGPVQAALLRLELAGWIRRRPGGRYSLAHRPV